MSWEQRDVSGGLEEMIVYALLNELPGSFIVICEGDDPEGDGDRWTLVVPQWGEA